MELHQKREPGQDVHIPIDEFMSIARTLETYGVDPHPVKVSSNFFGGRLMHTKL